MAEVGEKYECNICGNEVVVTASGGGTLVCCGEPMEKTGDGFECS
jgi:desulfoferrodoxin-like iron-binding protein